SLTKEIESPLLGLKKWILDANPEKNIEVMRAYNIDAVLLGNNHSNDFGSECLASSLSMLDQADINNAGAGLNADLAATPMIVNVSIDNLHRKIYIFSGYSFNHYEDSNF